MEKIIYTYLEGKASIEEQKQLLGWIRKDGNRFIFQKIKEEWQSHNGAGPLEGDMLRHWSELQRQMLEAGKRDIRSAGFRIHLFRYAAILAFTLFLTSVLIMILKSDFLQGKSDMLLATSLVADYGQMSKAILPDGSQVWLNSGSALEWDNQFGTRNRTLHLTGEGYFDVVQNTGLPMDVHCNGLWVRVTGTSFNIAAYENYNVIAVVLENGSLELYEPDGQSPVAFLDPGKMARLNRSTNRLEISTVNVSRHTAWKEGIINIYDQPLEDLVVRLEKRYNQKFVISDEVRRLRYTFTIKNESLGEIIKLMESITPIKTVQQNEIITFKFNAEKAKMIEKSR